MISRLASQDRRILYIIINSIPPYAYEVNNILALPNGMPYRARFRQEWMPEISSPNDIEYHDGVVVLRNWETAELIPLRRIRTTDVEPVGDIYYINYVLSDLIEYDSNKQDRLNQVKVFNEKAAIELRPFPNEPKSDLRRLVFLGADSVAGIIDSHQKRELSDKEYDNWGKILTLLGDMECFLDVDFLRFIRLTDADKKIQKIVRRGMDTRYFIENEKMYYLDILQRSFTLKIGDSSVTGRSIILSAEAESIKPVKDKFAIVGRYDRYQFTFKTNAQQKEKNTDIAIDIVRSDNKGPIPTIYIPIKIHTPVVTIFLRVMALVFFVFGSILLFLSDSLFPRNPDFARSVGILAMVISSDETRKLIMALLERISQIFSAN